jgi:hypothetical protein
MTRTKLTLAVAALTSLLVTGVAIAHERLNRTHTDAVMASFTVSQVRASDKTCTGTDGEYRQFKAVYKGTSTGDPRLTGEVWIRSHGLINQTTGYGRSSGSVAVRDATTGKWKARGSYTAVNTDLGVLHGFVKAHVKDRAAATTEEQSGSGKLYANFKGTFDTAGTTLTGQLGGSSGDSRTPAVIQSGGCDNGKSHSKKRAKHDRKKKSDRKDGDRKKH